MRRLRRPPAVMTGLREAQAIAANLGPDARITRLRRRLKQAELGRLVGLGQSEISHLELGHGARTSIDTWIAIGIALRRPVSIGFSRDVVDPALQDAGHLAAQELTLHLTASAGWRGRFEAPSDPGAPRHSTDIELSAADGRIVLLEIWNRLDDLGAAVRSSDRKLADPRAQAGRTGRAHRYVLVARGHERESRAGPPIPLDPAGALHRVVVGVGQRAHHGQHRPKPARDRLDRCQVWPAAPIPAGCLEWARWARLAA